MSSLPREKPASKSASKSASKTPPTDDRLSQHFAPNSVIDLSVDTKKALLSTLAEIVVPDADPDTIDRILERIQEREAQVSTYVGDGVAIPVAHVDCVEGIHLALARNAEGFPYGIDTDEPVKIVVLVIGHESLQEEHVRMLGAIAGLFKEPDLRERVLSAPDSGAVLKLLDTWKADGRRQKRRPQSQLILIHARKIAKEVGATAVVVIVESSEELKILKRVPRRSIFIVATSSRPLAEEAEKVVKRVLHLPRLPLGRDAKARVAALLALAHGLIRRGDVVAFLSGHEEKQLDTMTLVDTGREFRRLVNASGQISKGVRPEVLERVIELAVELSREGREGSAVGAVYVLVGDFEKLGSHLQQMVINPFHGYPEEQRNVLDPTLAETMKEFAAIDGAFVIRGDGVVVSAGTYLSSDEDVELPGGLGSRHRAAAAITKAVDCVAVTLSQSSGEITVFKQGTAVINFSRGETS